MFQQEKQDINFLKYIFMNNIFSYTKPYHGKQTDWWTVREWTDQSFTFFQSHYWLLLVEKGVADPVA